LLERGSVANSWQRERWNSLRLLTPNHQSRLPGYRYEGSDPDGYMTMAEVVGFVRGYAAASGAPVREQTTVTSVRLLDTPHRAHSTQSDSTSYSYTVLTTEGEWQCRCLVLASGACNLPSVPALRANVPAAIECISPLDYRHPGQLPDGGVLVVGASAT